MTSTISFATMRNVLVVAVMATKVVSGQDADPDQDADTDLNAGGNNVSTSWELNLEDPWTIAAIVILSLLLLLCMFRLFTMFVKCSVESEEPAVVAVVAPTPKGGRGTRPPAGTGTRPSSTVGRTDRV